MEKAYIAMNSKLFRLEKEICENITKASANSVDVKELAINYSMLEGLYQLKTEVFVNSLDTFDSKYTDKTRYQLILKFTNELIEHEKVKAKLIFKNINESTDTMIACCNNRYNMFCQFAQFIIDKIKEIIKDAN